MGAQYIPQVPADIGAIEEAPIDGVARVRKDGGWVTYEVQGIWHGTQAQYDALTTEEKVPYFAFLVSAAYGDVTLIYADNIISESTVSTISVFGIVPGSEILTTSVLSAIEVNATSSAYTDDIISTSNIMVPTAQGNLVTANIVTTSIISNPVAQETDAPISVYAPDLTSVSTINTPTVVGEIAVIDIASNSTLSSVTIQGKVITSNLTSMSTLTNPTMQGKAVSSAVTSTSTLSNTTTVAIDTTPTAFTFTDQTSVDLSTVCTSNTITVAGINSSAAISITGGTYSKNGGAYTATSGTVVNGDTINVRNTSSGTASTAVNTVLTISSVSDTFTTTTATPTELFRDNSVRSFTYSGAASPGSISDAEGMLYYTIPAGLIHITFSGSLESWGEATAGQFWLVIQTKNADGYTWVTRYYKDTDGTVASNTITFTTTVPSRLKLVGYTYSTDWDVAGSLSSIWVTTS